MFNAFANNQGASPFNKVQQGNSPGFFGQNKPAFGQNTSQPFAQNQANTPFSQNPTGQNLFNSTQPQQPQQNAGIFGQSNPSQGAGLFGQNNTQANTSGIFGGQQQPPANTGIFGGQQQQTPNAFGAQQGNQGGLFGLPSQQPPQQGGLFGNPLGGQPPTNPQGQGLFGGAGNPQPGIFGQPNQNAATFANAPNNANQTFMANQGNNFQGTTNNLFGGANTTNQAGGGIFGNNQIQTNNSFGNQNQNSNMFGVQNQQPQSNVAGNSLFGTFATSNNQSSQGSNVFGGPTAPSNAFGQNQQQGPNLNANYKLGGTSWGVPTGVQGTPPTANSQPSLVQPVRSKNGKLDSKHLVKCISALDQFQGLCKQELRVSFIQSGGQQPTLNQQGNVGFKPLTTNAPPAMIPSLPSFGGSQNIGTGNNLFGGQANNQSNLYAKPPVNAPASGIFANQQQQSNTFGAQQPNSLFGAPQPQTAGLQPQTNSLFNPGNNASFLQPNPMNTQQPQQNSLFGAPPQSNAFNLSPFNTQTNQGAQFNQNTFGGLFNAQAGQNQQGNGTMFGANTGSPFFEQVNSQMPNFGQALSASVLSNQAYAPNPLSAAFAPNPLSAAFAPNPLNQNYPQNANLFNPISNPNYPPVPGNQLDQATQILLPQIVMAMYMAQQSQQQRSGQVTGNPVLDALNNLVTTLSLNPNNQALTQEPLSPFDQFMMQENSNYPPRRSSESYSLFTNDEIKEFENIDARSFSYKYNQFRNQPKELDYQPVLHAIVSRNNNSNQFYQSRSKIVNKEHKIIQQLAKKKYIAKDYQLPQLGNDLKIYPSIQKLKNMTVAQLKKVSLVKVYNKFGAIEFLEPVSLYKVDLSSIISINQDNIHLEDSVLDQKKVRITFNNFGQYTKLNPDQKRKLQKKMRQWIKKCQMTEISHDQLTGNLVIQSQE